ncbi:MAG: AAA family ATPase, partial [Algoriella sp.]
NKINSKKSSNSQSIILPPKPFVLIIDEINRGNVSQIFGELITLIEEDKRLGNDEAIEVTLPYSKEKFGVPSNLYIIGTMNTADRSVEALDTALRRRFVFEEMPPKYDLDELQENLFGFTASHLLVTINKRIEKLLDSDHQIGHAYFLNKDENTIITSFYKNIIPLLQEYFFGDYGKIGLVLGSGFVDLNKQDHENQSKSIFASFGYENDISAYEERKSYKILGLNDKDFDFGNAIKLLMNK